MSCEGDRTRARHSQAALSWHEARSSTGAGRNRHNPDHHHDHSGRDDHLGAVVKANDVVGPGPAVRTMSAIGTTATVVVTDPPSVDAALALLADDLAQLDAACSRFRPD